MSADNKNTKDDNSPENLKWSKTALNEIVWQELFPSAVKDLHVQKDIITKFYNFYLGGRIQKGLGVEDIVFGVFSILPISPYNERIIWTDKIYHDNGKAFFLRPGEKLASEVQTVVDKSDDVQDIVESENKEMLPENEKQKNKNIAEELQNMTNDTETLKDHIFEFDDDQIKLLEINNMFNFDEGADDNDDYYFNMITTEALHENRKREKKQDNNDLKDPIEIKPNNILPGFGETLFDFTSKTGPQENIISYGPVENAAFVKCCNDLLSCWDTDGDSRALLKSFFGVVALVLMRATTKSYKHLFSTFRSEKFLRLLLHCRKRGLEHYAPPHKRCLKGAYRTFNRRDGKIPSMFAKLMYIALSSKSNKYMKYVCSNGLMNYTADYGFNLIRLLRTVSSVPIYGGVKEVMKLTLCEETKASWKKVVDFVNEYGAESPSEDIFSTSYRWARVLDGRYFKEVSCQQNYGLAVILAVFSEQITGDPGVWQSTWVENDDLEKYRDLGNRLYTDNFLSKF